jgi:hypothetical protein
MPLRRDGSREWIQRFLQDLLVRPGRHCEIVFQQRLGPARPSLSKPLSSVNGSTKRLTVGDGLDEDGILFRSPFGVFLSRLSPKVVDIDGGVYKWEEEGGGRVVRLKFEWGS